VITQVTGAKRLESVQVMRGVAASMVMLWHFTSDSDSFRSAFPSFSRLFFYGDLGVWMFFAISGFVIPYAMDAMKYEIKSGAWPFFVRRLVRLEPPYIISVFLALTLSLIAARIPGHHGSAPSVTDFLLQFLYLGPWFHVRWINDVAWTLAIEFQYYLLMLFAAPLLLSRSVLSKVVFFSAVIALSLIVKDKRAVFLYLPCFAVGFAVFLFHSRRIALYPFVALCGLFVGLTAFNNGVPPAVITAISAALILVPIARPVPVLSFLGTISYSLYLVHVPIGDRLVNLTMQIYPDWNLPIALIGAIAISVSAAIALWYCVERPSHLLAKTMFTRRTSSLDTVPVAASGDAL
jgi:peptidoglycan/LPS O-acetylase OafA/YrhL